MEFVLWIYKKDGKTLYFSDDEITNETDGEKKVFVTKRINGKESHVKVKKPQNREKKEIKTSNFNFNNEIVIGINKNNNTTKQKKPNNKKNKKRNLSKKKVSIFISSILLIGVIIVFLLKAPIFNVSKIEVVGNNIVTKENIINISGIKLGENIFKYGNKNISKIKENMYVDDVKINKVFPNTVKISIKEREIKYQINLINSFVYIDKNGYILENSTLKKDVPIIIGFTILENDLLNKKRLETKDLETLSKINKIMESAKTINIDNLITEINIEKEYILNLEAKAKKIYIGDASNLINKMLYVQKILEKEEGKTGTIFVNGDISAGFKPYFREVWKIITILAMSYFIQNAVTYKIYAPLPFE